MSSINSGHLTDEQFAECIAKCANVSPESEAHLRECVQCCEELARFSESMDDFSAAAFRWSEAQPAVSLRAVARPRTSHAWFAPAAWSMVTALVLVAGIPMMMHRDPQPAPTTDAVLQEAPADSDAQIAADNRLMRSVNMAIGVNDSSPLQGYGLQTGHRAKLKTVSGLRSEY